MNAKSYTAKNLNFIIWALIILVVWAAAEAIFLFFAGVLLAVAFRAISNYFKANSRLSDGWAVSVAIFLVVAVSTLAVWLSIPILASQLPELQNQLPQALDGLEDRIREYHFGQEAVDQAQKMRNRFSIQEDLLPHILGFASSFVGGIAGFAIIFFSGIYFAISPSTYRRGLILLFPKRYEKKLAKLLDEIGETLQWWLVGKVSAMLVVGILSWIGLLFLGIPLAAILAMLGAILTFIPNIGPVIAAVPPILLGFTVSSTTALYVLILYLVIQAVETYLLTPYVEKQTVSLAPGLTLFAQVVMGVIFGGIGLAVATPLAAVGLVIFDQVWVKRIRSEGRQGT